MRKKLPPGFNLNFDLDKIIDKLLNKVFGVVDKALGNKSKKSGVPGVTEVMPKSALTMDNICFF